MSTVAEPETVHLIPVGVKPGTARVVKEVVWLRGMPARRASRYIRQLADVSYPQTCVDPEIDYSISEALDMLGEMQRELNVIGRLQKVSRSLKSRHQPIAKEIHTMFHRHSEMVQSKTNSAFQLLRQTLNRCKPEVFMAVNEIGSDYRDFLKDIFALLIEPSFRNVGIDLKKKAVLIYTGEYWLEDNVHMIPERLRTGPEDLRMKHHVGPYVIRLNLAKRHQEIPYDVYDAVPTTELRSYFNHPHIDSSESKLCAGEAKQPIRHAMVAGRLWDSAMMIHGVLGNYVGGNAYWLFNRADQTPRPHRYDQPAVWGEICPKCEHQHSDDQGRECTHCEEPCCTNCSSECYAEGCEEVSCNDCRTRCASCRRYYCDEHTSACPGCDCGVCEGCVKRCHFGTCANAACGSCLSACADCGIELCRTCRKIDDDSEEILCPTCYQKFQDARAEEDEDRDDDDDEDSEDEEDYDSDDSDEEDSDEEALEEDSTTRAEQLFNSWTAQNPYWDLVHG